MVKDCVVAQKYKACEIEFVEIIQKIDEQKVFYQYGYNSLFQYVVKELGLSSEVTYVFINVARKSKEIPELKEEIKKGRISISKAKKITSVITTQNKKHWLDLARYTTKRKLEKEVALASPRTIEKESLNYIHPRDEVKEKVVIKKINARIQLQVGVSEKLMLKLRRAQDILSQKKKYSVNLEALFEVVAEEFIQKHDPLVMAKRQKVRGKLNENSQVPGPVNIPAALKTKANNRSPLPAKLRHQVYLKFQGQCGHETPHGARCLNRRFLEVHHIRPVSHGGSDHLDNLSLLCSGHHKMTHFRDLSEIRGSS